MLGNSRHTKKRGKGLRFPVKKGLGIWNGCRRRLTVMLVPHWERGVLNFQFSLLTLVFAAFVVGLLLGGGSWLLFSFTDRSRRLRQETEKVGHFQGKISQLAKEVSDSVHSARAFEKVLQEILSLFDPGGGREKDLAPKELYVSSTSPPSAFSTKGGRSRTQAGLGQLQELKTLLDGAVEPLGEIRDHLEKQRNLLSDVPSMWPLKGVRGTVTSVFGPAIHPFTGEWYLHEGLDIAYGYGAPIVATANGKVVRIDFNENGFGLYVLIRHRYGFATRYAHLHRSFVKVGQVVKQGEVIGSMGNTGLSTGPHLHYEVWIGSQIVSPSEYLNMRGHALRLLSPHLKRVKRDEWGR